MNKTRGNLLLLLTAMIWGAAFSAQSAGMDHVGPWTFNCLRTLIGAMTLTILMPVLDRISGVQKQQVILQKKELLKTGVILGAILCAASMFQQTGIQYTTAGKAGFVTALYVVFVPVGGLLIGKKTNLHVWIAVLIAAAGFWFLSVSGEFAVSTGDWLLLMCSILFAAHILVIDKLAGPLEGIRLSCIQFFISGLLCLVPMIVLEHPQINDVIQAAVPILYAGVLSCGAGYTLQLIGQKYADPVSAGMILSLESVFSVLFGFILLHEMLMPREILGCVLVFAAVLLSQMPVTNKK